jgi:hypothetical protein
MLVEVLYQQLALELLKLQTKIGPALIVLEL